MYDETKLETVPHVGMDATYRIGSDRYAGKIIAVSGTRHRCTFSNGRLVKECTRRRNGAYKAIGSDHGDLVLGVAVQDLDPGF
jgi:hypothetical protein